MNKERWRAGLIVAVVVAAASIPLSAQKIVYQSTRGTDVELFRMAGDGTEQTNLTNATGNDRFPKWSPDGTKVVFYSERDGNAEIYVSDEDGANATRLTFDPGLDVQPVWSPDGAQIAFTSERGGNFEVYVMNADGSNQHVITTDSITANFPRWSPDGSKIVYSSGSGFAADLYIVNADGTGQRRLTYSPGFNSHHQWSPDGLKIAFTSDRTGDLEIFVINADGTGLDQLTVSPGFLDYDPFWSLDGTQILFATDRDGNLEVYVMSAFGANPVNLSNNPAFDYQAHWSPDGSRVIFASMRDGNSEIYLMRPDGTGVKNLTNRSGADDTCDAFGVFETTPTISDGGIVLGNLTPTVKTISALSIISIFGTNFSTESILFPTLDGTGRLSTVLGGVCVEIGGERAPIFAVTPNQLNVQVPAIAALGLVQVVVIVNCDTPEELRSGVATVNVEAETPGFFLFQPLGPEGLIAARFNEDNVAVAPDGQFDDQFGLSRPAEAGDVITLYGTGWGATEPGLGTGELAKGPASLLSAGSVMVTFGGVPLAPSDIFYVGVTPYTAGLYQLAIRVPGGAASGVNQVVLTVAGKSTPVGPGILVAGS